MSMDGPLISRMTLELDRDLAEKLDLLAAKLTLLSRRAGGPRVEMEDAALRALASGIDAVEAELPPISEMQSQIDRARPSRRRTMKQEG
jgi:hypothetical protein